MANPQAPQAESVRGGRMDVEAVPYEDSLSRDSACQGLDRRFRRCSSRTSAQSVWVRLWLIIPTSVCLVNALLRCSRKNIPVGAGLLVRRAFSIRWMRGHRCGHPGLDKAGQLGQLRQATDSRACRQAGRVRSRHVRSKSNQGQINQWHSNKT